MGKTPTARRRAHHFERTVLDAKQVEVTCPAGTPVYEAVGGTSCRCLIEHQTVQARFDPSSLARYCMGNYQTCPTWRAHKDAIRAGNDREMTREIEAEVAAGG